MTLFSEMITPSFREIENITINEIIKYQALRFPDKIAVKHNNNYITYSELELSSNKYSFYFKQKGFIKGQVVGVALDRSIPMTLCLLALMKAGITYLPIDPSLPLERVRFLLQDTSASALITSKKYAGLYKAFPDKFILEDINLDEFAYNDEFTIIEAAGNDLTYIIYTSGSTGTPKGVPITHKSLLNLLLSRQDGPGITNRDNMIGITTMSFDIAEEELYLPLINGAQLTIVDTEVTKDGRALLDILSEEKITIMQATPYIWQMLLESGWDYRLPIKAFSGGEALTKDLAGKLLERCDELWNMYGPTETTICSITKRVTNATELITIGKPIANTQVYILNNKLEEVPVGEEGELYIGGVGVAQGYLNRPELTEERFISDIFSTVPGQKMYKTGDIGRFYKNGEIQFLGRSDHQIKIRGYRIETEEIEFNLKKLPGVKDALVIVYTDDIGNNRLVAYVVKIDHIHLSSEEISEWKQQLKVTLPDYMIPSDYLSIDKMPLLINGKIDRKKLPDPEIKNNSNNYVAPQTELQRIIAKIWKKNLNIDNIGIKDNFFDLGGTSLIAIKTQGELQNITNRRLAPSILFKYSTIEKLESLIKGFSLEPFKSLIPIKTSGTKIPLYILPGSNLNVFFFRDVAHKLSPDQPVYGLQALDLDDAKGADMTIEQLADFYVNEIITHNPTGPYAIAGYSIGGVIAFEMVKQLKIKGKDVKLLAMFDTNLRTPMHKYSIVKKTFIKIIQPILWLKFRIILLIKWPRENIIDIYNTIGRRLNNLMVYAGISNKNQLPEHMIQTVKNIKSAFNRYEIIPYDVSIDLFVAKRSKYYTNDPKFLGWKKYALNGIRVYELSTNHNEMFSSSEGVRLAAMLQSRLNEMNS